jgi:hypothetical protein
VVFCLNKCVVAAREGRTAPPLSILRYIYPDTDWKDHQRVQHMHVQWPDSLVQLLISVLWLLQTQASSSPAGSVITLVPSAAGAAAAAQDTHNVVLVTGEPSLFRPTNL